MTDPSGPAPDPKILYDAEYYASHLGDVPYDRSQPIWHIHFGNVARNIRERLRPRTVLDVGCAKGFLVEHLRDLGVEAFGIDGSPHAVSEVREDVRPHCRVADCTEPLEGRYDLVTCIEVAEHLTEEQGEKLIDNLCRLSDTVLFSSTPEDFDEPTHFNVRPVDYWVERFAQRGFYPVLRHRPDWVTPWALVFRKMTRPLKIAVLSKERPEWAVVRLRLLDPLRELVRRGRAEVSFASAADPALDVEALLDADLWIVQREFADRQHSSGLVEAARLLGKTLVFEIDDLLLDVPRSNPLWPYAQRIHGDLRVMMRHADFVTASTRELVEEIGRFEPTVPEKAHVLRNCVDPRIWGEEYVERRPAPGAPLVIGWFGSPTHREDLEIVRPAIAYLARKWAGRVEFHFFGYLPDSLRGIPGVKLARGGCSDVVEHARSVRAAPLHLALAPLTDHPFNRAKSDLKWLEYSICSIPGIYSDVAPYRAAITHGVDGVVVPNDTAAWVEAIEHLVEDEDLRLEIGRRAFHTVRERFSVDRCWTAWDDLYRSFVVTGPRERAEDAGSDRAISRAAALLFEMQGRNQAAQGRLASTVESHSAAVELDPERASHALETAARLASSWRFEAASRLFERVAACAGEDSEAAVRRLRFLAAVDDPVAVERAARALLPAAARDPAVLAEVLAATKGAQGSLARGLRRALSEARPAPEIAAGLAEALCRHRKFAEARDLVERCAREHVSVDLRPLLDAIAEAERRQPSRRSTAAGENSPRLGVLVAPGGPACGREFWTTVRAPMRALERSACLDVRYADGVRPFDPADLEGRRIVLFDGEALARPEASERIREAKERGLAAAAVLDGWPGASEAAGAEADRTRRVVEALGALDAVAVTSPALADLLARLVEGVAGKVRVLPAGLDVEVFSSTLARRPPEGRPVHVGLFGGHAGPGDLKPFVAALAPLVERRGGRLVLTTWRPDQRPDDELVDSPSVGCASSFYAEYARFLQRSTLDVALVPVSSEARYATRGDTLFLELAAARVPGVFAVAPPFDASVIDGRTGLLVPNDPRAFAEAAELLLSDQAARNDLAERAWTIVQAERTAPQLAPAFLAWLEAAAGGSAEPGAVAIEAPSEVAR